MRLLGVGRAVMTADKFAALWDQIDCYFFGDVERNEGRFRVRLLGVGWPVMSTPEQSNTPVTCAVCGVTGQVKTMRRIRACKNTMTRYTCRACWAEFLAPPTPAELVKRHGRFP